MSQASQALQLEVVAGGAPGFEAAEAAPRDDGLKLSESSAINGHIAYLMVPLWINMDYIIWINMVYMVPIITYL